MSCEDLLQCYNRGCGKKYKLLENTDDACQHHPGEPFFHDAYKGWSCCNKKCTNFTEFLNIKGCIKSRHSNIKPPEPTKLVQEIPDTEIIEVKPIIKPVLERPPFDTPLVIIQPEIAPSLKQQLVSKDSAVKTNEKPTIQNEIAIGTLCKNNSCNLSYIGPESDLKECVYHPGLPVFHEGLKYWSCCTKRTSDFNAFLSQAGCTNGKHVWPKEDSNKESIQCRWDYHQTASHVIVSIYAKQYCPDNSEIKLNPIRLCAKLFFPQQANASFNMDVELRGIVNMEASSVTMMGTKVEIKLKKAEPGSWSHLDIPKKVPVEIEPTKTENVECISNRVGGVDLSDL